MTDLSGKVALVIGGTRGIGGAISRRFARDGAALAVVHQGRQDAAAQLAMDLAGGSVLAVQGNAGSPTDLKRVLDEVLARFGRVDMLVYVAGMAITGDLADYPDDAFDRVFALNVRGAFDAVRRLAPVMGDGGRVILIGSAVADHAPGAGLTLYAASKAALGGLVRGLARDLAPRGITANLVQPGPVDTERNPARGPHASANQVPLAIKRHGTPEELASLVAWLASPDAAFVTGATYAIDGGWGA